MTTHVPAERLISIYDRHPLREETILARVLRHRGSLDGVTELDLAHDSLTEITDQNHIGGVAAVVQMAARSGITRNTRVLDLGAGLNGAGRVLAMLLGCRVHGVELSPLRAGDGERLTARVGLTSLVTISCGDAVSAPLPAQHFDIVWGQGAWMHIADLDAMFARAAEVLASDGRIVFEEGCALREARDEQEAGALEELERLWAGRFQSEQTWRRLLAGAGFTRCTSEDVTDALLTDCERLLGIARSMAVTAYPADETNAFPLAVDLVRRGVIGYRRFIASR